MGRNYIKTIGDGFLRDQVDLNGRVLELVEYPSEGLLVLCVYNRYVSSDVKCYRIYRDMGLWLIVCPGDLLVVSDVFELGDARDIYDQVFKLCRR